jgi:hypothetical protein
VAANLRGIRKILNVFKVRKVAKMFIADVFLLKAYFASEAFRLEGMSLRNLYFP